MPARSFDQLIALYERKSTHWLSENLPRKRVVSGKACPLGLHGEAIQRVYRRRLAAEDAARRAAQQPQDQDEMQRLLRAFDRDAGLRVRLKALPAGPERDAAMQAAFVALGV